MSMKKKEHTSSFGDDLKKFNEKVESLWRRGYAPVASFSSFDCKQSAVNSKIDDCETKYDESPEIGKTLVFDRFRSVKVLEGKGSGRGYILYGKNNLLPVKVEKFANGLPYTAQGIDYLTNLLAGNGLGFMYKYAKVVGDEVKDVSIPYEFAGTLLAQRIKSLHQAIKEKDEDGRLPNGGYKIETPPIEDNTYKSIGDAQYRRKAQPQEDPSAKYANENYDDIGTDEALLEEALADYRKWKETMDWIKEFKINSGSIDEIIQQWASDTTLYNISYMRIQLEQGTTGSWGTVGNEPKKLIKRPRIVGIAYQPAQCSRLEAMDDRLHINYVYYAEQWRYNNTKKDADIPIVAYPCIETASRWRDLDNIVLENQKTKPSERPCVCAPIYVKGTNSPYYPTCSWWSIFPSMIYYLTVTLMTDMATSKKNSTMWSKIIYIDVDWFERYATQKGCDTDEAREKLRQEYVDKIKDFLSRRDNQGSTVSAEKIILPDGKISHNIEVVDVPQPTAKASLEDLEKLTSCIFFALGIHPALIGAVPGANKSSSGTQQRELALLKQLQLVPQQKRILSLFEFIRDWNNLDPHLSFSIKKYVLSTLDRSNTGLVEDEGNE